MKRKYRKLGSRLARVYFKMKKKSGIHEGDEMSVVLATLGITPSKSPNPPILIGYESDFIMEFTAIEPTKEINELIRIRNRSKRRVKKKLEKRIKRWVQKEYLGMSIL